MIVDSKEQFQNTLQEIEGRDIILIPILEDEFIHIIANRIVGYYIQLTESRKYYTIMIEHPEAIFTTDVLPYLSKCSKIYCYNKQALTYNRVTIWPNMVDAFMQMYLYDNEIPEVHHNKSAEFYQRRIPIKTSLVTDLMKVQARCKDIANLVSFPKNVCESFYETLFTEVFHTIESNGLKVIRDPFITRFGETNALIGDYVFTKYNFYTATGRPSNRFGGINFAALNKEDTSRELFIPRSPDNLLLELDFQSYHPRILADIVGYKLDDGENIYEHLAKHYFNTPTPTKEQISESKELTFKQLYGGISSKYKNIEYFNKVNNFTELLWESFERDGYIQSLISKRVLHKNNIEDVNPTKLLNYFIQLHETEQNVLLLSHLFKTLDEEIKPILYTYDSVLFDLPASKRTLLEESLVGTIPSRFPYRIKSGLNYKLLK